MSPRKNNIITTEPWPKWKKGRLYKARVKDSRIEKKSSRLHVVIESLDPGQLGRTHQINLALPVRPGNRACVFLSACGLDVDTAGTKVCLDQITNATVGMRFRGLGAAGTDEFDFEKIRDPSVTEPDSSNREQTRPAKASDDNAAGAAGAKSQTW